MTSKPAPSAARRQDAEARARALDTTRSFLVQAPAGSGKTELLIQRFLCLLAEVEEPEQVVAVTFTRKATGEMRQRVLEALRDAQEGKPFAPHQQATRQAALRVLKRDAACGWALVHSPARLRIFTLDALCASIVQRMPVTSRLGAGPQVTDKAEYLYARAARATVQLLGEEGAAAAAARRVLQHVENDVHTLEELLAGMLARRDQWLRHVEGPGDPAQVRARLEQAMVRIVRAQLQQRRDLFPEDVIPHVLALARHADALGHLTALPGCEPGDRAAWEALRDFLQTKGGTWRKQVPACIKAVREREQFSALMERLEPEEELRVALRHLKYVPPERFDEEQWEVMQALFVLLPRAGEELARVFREAGAVDFIEIARAAQHALGSRAQPTDLALGMGHAVRHLLLDEFQDTSVTQFELLKSLTAGWRPGDGHTLFLVGDPMQSIFRFRQAEVGLFLEVWEGSVPGLDVEMERLRLQYNFRAQPALVDWVNATFPTVFPQQDDVAGAAVAYTPCIASRPAVLRLREQVHPFLHMPGEARQVADEAEARRVVELIQQARARSPQGSIAILVRARTHLAAIVPALKQAGITFRAVEIDSLAERPVVMDLLALTRALLHPADRPAWFSVLRAPWCGLTLADLLALAGDPPPPPPAEEPAEEKEEKKEEKRARPAVWDQMQRAEEAALSPEGLARLLRVRGVLQAALERRRRLPLRQWVESAWIALGGPACLGSETELLDAAQFFELLEQHDSGGEPADMDELTARMQELFAAPDNASPDPVQIMTIYIAKGLEFDTVLVPGMGKAPRSDEKRLLLWEERPRPEGAELLLAPLKPIASRDNDPLYSYVQRVEAGRTEQEGRRLLYVAATRAKDELHLLGHAAVIEDRKEGGLKLGAVPQTSLLAFLWPVVQAQYEAELAERKRPRAAAAPRQMVIPELAAGAEPSLRRLPAKWSLPTGPPPLPAPPAAEPERDTEDDISFRWVGQTARHVGTVTHLILQRMAREGLSAWDPARLRRLRPLLRALLANEGVAPEALEKAATDVLAALEGTLADPRGRWTLEPHREAHSEYALSGVAGGRLWNVKMDRTFLDERGTRWIVDYKASPHKGGKLEDFLANEQARYREKLEVYAALLAQMEEAGRAPIRIGLYFPLLRAWREWAPGDEAADPGTA